VNFSGLGSGLNDILTGLQQEVNSGFLNGGNLPLLGTQLTQKLAGTQVLTSLGSSLKTALSSLTPSSTATNVITDLQSLSGVQVTVGTPVTLSGGQVEIPTQFILTPTSLPSTLTFDSGLPGLPLSFIVPPKVQPPQVQVNVSYTLTLNFAADSSGNIYLDTTPRPVLDYVVSANIAQLNGQPKLGPLTITLTDGHLPAPWSTTGNPANTGVTAHFDVTVNPTANNLILSTDYKNNALADSQGALTGDGQINFGMVLSAGSDFPQVASNLHIDWPLGSPAVPAVQFNDVQMDVGSFVSNFVSPIVKQVQDALRPLKKFADVLSTNVPVLSDLSELVGNGPIELIQLLNNPTLTFLVNAVEDIENLNTSAGSSLIIQYGSFDLGGYDLRSTSSGLAQATPQNLSGNFAAGISQIDSRGQSPVQALLDNLENTLNVQFPILDNQSAVFQLLLGQNVTLFQFTLPHVDTSAFQFDKFFAIFGPLGIEMRGGLNISADFTFGYDTYGFSIGKPFEGFFIGSPTQLSVSATITAGPAINIAVAEVDVSGGLTGNLTLTLNDPGTEGASETPGHPDGKLRPQEIKDDIQNGGPFALFNLSGSLTASLNFHAQVGIQTFLGFIGVTYDKVLANTVLVNFNLNGGNTTQDPVLAGAGQAQLGLDPSHPNFYVVQNPTGLLILNMGPYAHYRLNGDTNDDNENFEVSYVSGNNDPSGPGETVAVSAFGYTQVYEGVKSILAEGGFGSDTIIIDPDVTVPADLYAGVDHQDPNFSTFDPAEQAYDTNVSYTVTSYGKFNALLDTNILQAGGGNTTLHGGEGDDPIKKGDYLIGGSGANVFYGGNAIGANVNQEVMIGGTGSNEFHAGNGGVNTMIGGSLAPNVPPDRMFGGASDNYFVAGSRDAIMTGGQGTNYYLWQYGDGNLSIVGSGQNFTSPTDFLQVAGASNQNNFFSISRNGLSGVGVQVPTLLANKAATANLIGTNVQVVSVDAVGGNNTYNLGDLSFTTVREVDLNLHDVGSSDNGIDTITVNGSPLANQINVFTLDNQIAGNTVTLDSHGNPVQGPTQKGTITEVDLSTQAANPLGRNSSSYSVKTSIPASFDSLTVNGNGGKNVINVLATQAKGVTNINGGPDDDTINVSSQANLNGNLDSILGPLNIDAQGGRNNQINFSEKGSYVNDQISLYSNMLVRNQTVTGTPPTNPLRGGGQETGAPFVINYTATGGLYGGGVNLWTSFAQNKVYIPTTAAGDATTPVTTTVTATFDQITVGYDAFSSNGLFNNSQLGNIEGIKGPLTIHGLSGSTLNTALIVHDPFGFGNSYLLNQNTLLRSGHSFPITFDNLKSLQLDASFGANNSINVTGTAAGTAVTVNVDGGLSNNVTAGDSLNRIDNILGPLTINGGKSSNALTIHDEGNGLPQNYHLYAGPQANAGTLVRNGTPQTSISFSALSSLTFDASQNTGTNSITVHGTPVGLPVTINTGDGTVSLSVGTLDNVQGPLAFHWSKGNKVLVVDDSATVAGPTYTLAAGSLSRTGMAGITFDHLQNLILFTGLKVADKVTVQGTAPGTNVSLILGNAQNTVLVGDPQQDLDPIQGPLNITGSGTTQVTLDDQKAGARNYQLYAAQFVAGAPVALIQFTSITNLVVNGSNQHDTYLVVGTPAGTSVTLNTGAGANDVVTVGAAPSLNAIQGALAVNAQGSGAALVLDDSNNNSPTTYTLAAGSVTRTGMNLVSYQNLVQLTLKGGSKTNTYRINSTSPGMVTNVSAGAGSGNFQVQVTPTNSWQVNLDGGLGTSSLSVVDTQGSGVVKTSKNLLDPTSGAVTVTYPVNGPIVTVNFQHMANVDAVSDVSSRVQFKSTLLASHADHYVTQLQITNTSSADINGNLRIVLDGLNPLVALTQVVYQGQKLAIQHVNGQTYFTIPVSVLSAGQTLDLGLEFFDPMGLPLTFLPHTYAVSY
jgi:hypothetical protein